MRVMVFVKATEDSEAGLVVDDATMKMFEDMGRFNEELIKAGIMLDGERLLHANGHHMAVAIEPLNEAVERIRAAGVGEPTAYRRP